MANIVLGVVAYAAGIAAVCLAYAAGRLDGRREARHQQHTRTDAPIPMEHTHGGDADDL